MVRDEPWIKQAIDGIFGQWHMPAGEGQDFILTACDRHIDNAAQLDRRDVGQVAANERCPVCQDLYRVREER